MEISNELRRLVDPNGKCCCEYCLINKCKEWNLSKGYSHLSGKDDIYEKGEGFVCSIGSTTLLIKDFYADTEIEATIEACNWILGKEIQEENRLQLQEDLTEYNKLIKEGL